MRKYVLIFVLALVSVAATAQISVSYSAGYGTYDLGGMHDALEARFAAVKKTLGESGSSSMGDNYPNGVFHSFELGYAMGKEEYAFQITYMGTKADISYKNGDISNEEKSSLSGLRFGTLYRRNLFTLPVGGKRQLVLYGEISPGVIISKLNYKGMKASEELVPDDGETAGTDSGIVGVGSVGVDLGGSSTSFSILPAVGARLDVTEHIGLRVSLGYDFSFGGSIENMGEASVNWSGVRAKAGLAYTF